MHTIDHINSLEDLKKIAESNSGEDNESINFEFKGQADPKIFLSSVDKKKLSKEICAFANTYGGIVCYHGTGNEITPLSELSNRNYQSLETWLRDCLEPPLAGIDCKDVEGVVLISVPESITKPHRTLKTRDYYYRSSTVSNVMPEIMVSALYRAQKFLSVAVDFDIKRMQNRLQFNLKISNLSTVCGTDQLINIYVYTDSVYQTPPVIKNDDFDMVRVPPLKLNNYPWLQNRLLKSGIHDCIALSSLGKLRLRNLYPNGNTYYTFESNDLHVYDFSNRSYLVKIEVFHKESDKSFWMGAFLSNRRGEIYLDKSTVKDRDIEVLASFAKLPNNINFI